MKKIMAFIDVWGIRIVFLLSIIIFFRTCSTNPKVVKVEKRIDTLEILVSKINQNLKKLSQEIQQQIKIEGLKSEKRMIQSTDRKILDVNRQSEIDKEIEKLQSDKKSLGLD